MNESVYEDWHEVKVRLQTNQKRPYFYERDIWWVAIGMNLGDEEYGKGCNFVRPVLIMKRLSQNLFFGFRSYDLCRLLSKIGMIDQFEFAVVKEKMGRIIF
jgi:hypothetical protein